MTSTSSEPVVLRGLTEDSVGTAYTAGDLRTGRWTRHGADALRGDAVTERALQGVAERAAASARAQGFAAGWADGVRAAQQRASAELDAQSRAAAERHRELLTAQETALDALEAAVAGCRGAAQDVVDQVSGQVVELAMRIAEAVLDRELAVTA